MAYFQNGKVKNAPKRSETDYLESSRSELVNHLKTEIKKKPKHDLKDFLTSSLWSWIYHYFKSRFGKKFPYPSCPAADTGIYDIGDTRQAITIGITSDWATDTPDSFRIAEQISSHDPDFTIHVGDTYYVGAPLEIDSNFVNPGSPWVRGKRGSFAVLGNHEMYARGVAFFERLLATLGMRNTEGAYLSQKTGYFCLHTKYWRILGLDTGYNSTGIPILEFLPWFSPDCRFPDELVEWLDKSVGLKNEDDKRGIIILTHHQYITAFEKESEYAKPGKQLAALIPPGRKVIWLWGHEHKLSFFSKETIDDRLAIYGRCMGNGGTPIEINKKSFKPSSSKKGSSKLVGYDRREQKKLRYKLKCRLKNKFKEKSIGFNGYLLLSLDNEHLTISYYDNDNFLLSEYWTVNLSSGQLAGKIEVPADNKLTLANDSVWNDAVK
jgi:predicted phosphodiesterase